MVVLLVTSTQPMVRELKPDFFSTSKNPSYEILVDLFARATSRHLKAGETLFRLGVPSEGCYLLDQGLLKISLESPDGVERIVGLLSKGSIVGDLNLIGEAVQTESVVALVPCNLRYVSRACFNSYAELHPEVYRLLANMLAKHLHDCKRTLADLNFRRAKGRVAQALLTIAEGLGEQTEQNQIVIPEMMAQRDLAALAGVSRENVNRILKNWERRQLLSKSLRMYHITDKQQLKHEVDVEK